MGALLISWSVRLALGLLFGALVLRLMGLNHPTRLRVYRQMLGAGFLFFLAHVIAAFHFHHGWSHAAAVEDTRRQTRAMLGFDFGSGVYFNYAFLVAWFVEWTLSKQTIEQQSFLIRCVRMSVLVFMLFITFNGLVVFKSGWLRASGIVASFGLVGVGIWSRKRPVSCKPT